MHDCPNYDALSYCWGTAPRSLTILCNGRELPVTVTVASAILRLQLRGYKYPWLDAICINQDDLPERESQVQVMQSIYGRATRVWIWIGGDEATDAYGFASRIAFPTLELYAKDPSAAAVARQGRPVPQYREWTTTSTDKSGVTSTHHHNDTREIGFVKTDNVVQRQQNKFTAALEHILQQPCFDRVWCVQEAIMGRRAIVLSGPHEIEWDRFCRGLQVAVQSDESCQQTWGALRRDSLIARRALNMAVYQRPKSEGDPASFLLDLLFKYRARKATDPRDKVYTLLGIVAHFFSESGIAVSYTKEARDVYRDTSVYISSKTCTLHMLSACGQRVPLNSTLSWVPDWSFNDALPKPF